MGKEKKEVVKWCRCVDKPCVDRVCFTLPVIRVCMDCGKRIRQADLRDTQCADSRKQVPDKRSRENYIDIDKMMESKDFRSVAVKIKNKMLRFKAAGMDLKFHVVEGPPKHGMRTYTSDGSVTRIKLSLCVIGEAPAKPRNTETLFLTGKQEKDLWKGMKAVKNQLKKDLARNRDK